MRTGVLVHGCNLNIENWRYVAWGDPPDELGRIPQGLLVAIEYDADVVILGTGASRKEFRFEPSPRTGQELVEADYSLEYLRLHFDQLRSFPVIESAIQRVLGNVASTAENVWIEFQAKWFERIRLDAQSQNTWEELTTAGEFFLEAQVERVILVSSPSHIVRCLRDASTIFTPSSRFAPFCHRVSAVPSTTCYEGTSPADVVVVEPPHRPDRHVVPTHRRIQRMLALQKLAQADLVRLIEEFDDLLQRYEDRYYNQGQ